jgi:hypothetical protein
MFAVCFENLYNLSSINQTKMGAFLGAQGKNLRLEI